MTLPNQKQLNFEKIAAYQKRQFVPEDALLTSLKDVKALYQALLGRAINSKEELERWILDRSEFEAALDQAGSILYIRMTCQTDDKDRAKAYTDFIETIAPATKPLDDQLNKRFLKEIERFPIDQERYEIYIREIRADIDLFIEKNVDLQTKEQLLSQEYQTVCGAMTVEFEGEEKTLPQMGKYLLETDRALREQAWRATAKRRLQDKDKLDDIFDQMLVLRSQIAHNAKCCNYTEYKFRSLHRFDYTPEDCKKYHETVKRLVVPLWASITENRKKQMKLDSLRPWDSAVDPLGRAPLKPFVDVEKLISGCEEIFKKVDAELGQQFREMAQMKLLDLASRKGKAPGGYQSALDEARKPFIFMNAVGVDGDVRTLLHEAGHAFHGLACAHDPLVDYRHAPMEFNEVASMGMELLADQYLSVFYNYEDAQRSRTTHFEDSVFTLVWVAIIDAFQHWIYENPKHGRGARQKAWLDIRRQFGGDLIDWQGLEDEQASLWQRQLHIFEVPFYYIEYGIAQLGALQLWLNAKKDSAKALREYRQGLSFGGSRPLPELFKEAGIRFDFSENTIAPLMDAVKDELKRNSCEAS